MARLHSLLALAALALAASPAAARDILSVGVGLKKADAKIQNDRGLRILDPASGRTLAKLWGEATLEARLKGGEVTSPQVPSGPHPALLVRPMMRGALKYAGKEYRGQVLLRPDPGGGLNVINLVDVEDYLLGVLPKEMSPSAPAEALKAQAIAARTYALKHARDFEKRGFGLKASEGSQVYQGIGAEHPATTSAVHATRGKVLTHGGELIHAWFSAACGGHTAANDQVWGGSPRAYARGAECGYCTIFPRFHWSAEVPYDTLEERLAEVGRSVGTLNDVQIEWGKRGRAVKVRMVGDQGREELGGNAFRILAGHRHVRSLRFAPLDDPVGNILTGAGASKTGATMPLEERAIRDIIGRRLGAPGTQRTLILQGTGYGHGVGLCQWGARGMAEGGATAARILRHYYTGVKIQRSRPPAS